MAPIYNKLGLYNRGQIQAAIGEAFYVFSELSEDTVSDQLKSFDAGTEAIVQMRNADVAAITDIQAEIERLQASITARENHAAEADTVLARRAHVRETVAGVVANTAGFTLQPLSDNAV